MADPLSTASGVVGLVAFTFQSSKLLYEAVSSFQNNQRNVRELREELEALNGVLLSLQETAANPDVDFTALKLPLRRCGNGCREFEALIAKCTARSRGTRTSFRDWVKLTYMGDDIVGFKNLLAGYKSTIMIALADANMRISTVSVSVIKEYKQLIANTTADLEEHLQEIDKKLQSLPLQGAADQQRLQEERDSTQQCLGICAQFYQQIEQQPSFVADISTPSAAYDEPLSSLSGLTPARLVTAQYFKTCKDTLSTATTTLERNLLEINNRLQGLSSRPLETSNIDAAERARLQEEMESTKQSLAICAEASTQAHNDRTNLFEDISIVDDGQQVFVSTIGELITARRISAGSKVMQLMGQMSDASLQQFSRDRVQTAPQNAMEPQTGVPDTQFVERYGTGVTLSSQKLSDRLRHIHIEGSQSGA